MGSGIKCFIKLLPKTMRNRSLKKLVDVNLAAAAVGEGVTADVPAVEIQGRHAVG